MSKRARTSAPVNRTRSRRPIDKKLVSILKPTVTNVLQTTDLMPAASYPGTITGLRWNLWISNGAGTAQGFGRWAIVVVPAGTTASPITLSDAGSMYDPEQMVLAFGTLAKYTAGTANTGGFPDIGQTKAMRKLKAGDKLQFICLGVATNIVDIAGTVQFFYKT